MEGAGREGPLGERGAPVHEEPEPQRLQGALRRIPDAWFARRVADQAVLARGREPLVLPVSNAALFARSPFSGALGVGPVQERRKTLAASSRQALLLASQELRESGAFNPMIVFGG